MKNLIFFATAAFAFNCQAEPILVRPAFDESTCSKPNWPRHDMNEEHEGGVQVAALVGADGKVIRTAVQLSSGFPNLDAAAEAGIKRCLFRPGTVNQRPVNMLTTVHYTWLANESGALGKEWKRILKQAEQGDAAALYMFAMLQLGRDETKQNGLAMLQLVADAGFAMAEYRMARLYEEGSLVEKNDELAEQWYSKAQAHGDPLARERARLIQGASKIAQ